MAHFGTAVDRHPTARHGDGGASSSFGPIAVLLSLAVAGVALVLPAIGLAVLSSALLLIGFGLAAALWWRPAAAWSDGIEARDIAALLVLLGFIGALTGDSDTLFH